MGLERERMIFKRERLVGSWRRLREERVASDSGGDGASLAAMVDKSRTFAVRVLVKKFGGEGYFGTLA